MMMITPIDGIDDFEMRIKRQDAFWDRQVLDRPCVTISIPKSPGTVEIPLGGHQTHEERWLDAEYQADCALAGVRNTLYLGDALPIALPNLGPDFFPALYGGEIVFEETTSYIKPFLADWSEAAELRISWDNPYFLALEMLYNAYLEKGQGQFYTGWPDLHPGADCLVGWRGPQDMAMDMYDHPEEIKAALGRVTTDFFQIYDYYHEKLTTAGQAVTGWPGVVSSKKWHVPSNDFSYMLSPAQFDEFFLEGLRAEARFFEASLHHLDGPGCLNHLDSILDIHELSAVQWVPGAGNGTVTDWLHVFRKIQAADKGIQILGVSPSELDTVMEALRPEGVWLNLCGVKSEDEAEALLKKISRWV